MSIDDILRKPGPKMVINEKAAETQQFLDGFDMKKLVEMLIDSVGRSQNDIYVFDVIPNLKV
jgi:hypothetical protein